MVAFALYSNRKTGGCLFAGINALSTDTEDTTDTPGFDGNWSGSASAVLQPGQTGDDCGTTVYFSINIDKSKISGSLTDDEGRVITVKGAVFEDCSIWGFLKERYEAVGLIDGKASASSIDGEWYDFSGCYGTWQMQKQ